MLFNSYIFIFIFLPIVLIGYYALGRYVNARISIAWLVAASFFFYAWWNPAYLTLLLFSIIFNYGVGISLSSQDVRFQPYKKAVLVVGICVNLFLLGYFKYANFFVDTVNSVSGTSFHLDTIILPLAISFFTFQQIIYLVDAYRGNVKEPDFLAYCLFVSFFPQLISGPIVHHKEMMPQFKKHKKQAYFNTATENILIGFSLFSIGLFKKVIIADNMAEIVDPMFATAMTNAAVDPLYAWSAILAYAFQIYFDFSAYSDMALGLARMFGIRLPFNFNSPYKARNVFDYWNRWHMTLSRFMRNHVYIPLVKNKTLGTGQQAGLVISVLLGGLWHGANWTFVIWGGMHAVMMLINHAWHQFRRYLGHDLARPTAWGIVLAVVLTFVAGMFTRVFFRADSLDTALTVTSAMLGMQAETTAATSGISASYTVPLVHLAWYAILLCLVWFMPNSQEILAKYDPGLDPLMPARNSRYEKIRTGKFRIFPVFTLSPKWAMLVAIIFTLGIINIDHAQPFIYFQF